MPLKYSKASLSALIRYEGVYLTVWVESCLSYWQFKCYIWKIFRSWLWLAMNVCRSSLPCDWCLKLVTWGLLLLLVFPEQESSMLTNKTLAGTRESHSCIRIVLKTFEVIKTVLLLCYRLHKVWCIWHQNDHAVKNPVECHHDIISSINFQMCCTQRSRNLTEIPIRSRQQYKMISCWSGTLPAGLINENARQKGPTSPYCLKNMFLVV